jgi:hypothetical protein
MKDERKGRMIGGRMMVGRMRVCGGAMEREGRIMASEDDGEVVGRIGRWWNVIL